MKLSKPAKYSLIVAAALLLVVLLGVYSQVNPQGNSWFPSCPLHKYTGLHCPGCGTQRAIHHTLNGDFGMAMRYNPLLLYGLVSLIYAYGIKAYKRINPDSKITNIVYTAFYGWFSLVLVSIYFVLRNLPWEPFTYLAPPVG